ncbi:SulP family inorganic anion transporter [Fulvivirga sp. M361]|uniref:SulP family inorganic anion transporter n=1 Tax=Fulvivirga sp. M361 TaxID=2594266 RepID=UPI00117B44C0|nr:SulP family inorganic anion transporter [Fulvivirga sp. M361]TRX55935.1 SulP family inorganic anion transporter [Fulvivirga sp. M361]
MFSKLKSDLPAGLIVFLVAVPLCLGIALASGAPLFSGIIAGMVGGIVVSLISGSKIGVSGPAAGLAVIVADAIAQLGTNPEGVFDIQRGFSLFLSALVIAGIIQLILAFVRAGIIGYYFPNSVIKGMLSGIGILIILKQIPHALGHDVIPDGFFGFFQQDGENTFTEILVSFRDINPAAVIITVLSMTILVLWEQNFIKRLKVFQIIQGPLVVVVLGILLSNFFSSSEGYHLDSDEMVSIPLPWESGGFVNLFSAPDWSRVFTLEIFVIAVTLAVVASLETLLCVEATDKLDPEKNVTPTNRELLAQGVGNITSGLIGGLPITQVIVRSSANIQSGGKTKMSAFFHGILILVSAMFIPNVLNMIPLSSLAAILFIVGYKLSKPSLFIEISKKGKAQFYPFLVTILGIVFTDLLIGIGIGMALAIFLILYKNFVAPFSFREDHEPGKPLEIKLSENVTFLNKAAIMQALNVIPANSEVVIDASASKYIHPDVVEIFDNFKIHAESTGIKLTIVGDFKEDKLNHLVRFKNSVATKGNDNSYLHEVFNS